MSLTKYLSSKPCHSNVHDTMEEEREGVDRNESSEGKKSTIVPYYKLFSFADPLDFLLMAAGAAAAVASGLAMPFLTLLLSQSLNAFGESVKAKSFHGIYKVADYYVYVGMGMGAAMFLQVTCFTISGERQVARIRKQYLKAILRQEVSFFDEGVNVGEVVESMSGEALLVQAAIGEKAGTFIQEITTFLVGLVIAFIRGWKLTLVMLSIIPPLVLSAATLHWLLSKMAAKGQSTYSEATTIVEQTVGSIRTVASFTGEIQAVDNYKVSLKKPYKSSIVESSAAGISLGCTYFLLYSSYALCIWFGSSLILKDGYSGGDVIGVMFVVVISSSSAGKLSPCTIAFAAGQGAASKLFDKIHRKPEIDAYDSTGKILHDIRGDIELRDVYFSYPTRPDEQIFAGLSLSISSGTTVALVGKSGSGKSTVISLIERFYDPQSGEILIDGTNVKELQLRWIRGRIGLVSQEPILFASSIKDNIAYGKDDATLEEIKAAAELANASKFIDKLPQGLDTLVGERGTQLSGGQKQRVAIARAILKNPRIMLLDEPTSALDVESERVVQVALDRVMANQTTLVVAHRLSTVRNADVINVIHQGSVVEKGSHSELLKDPNGSYAQLIHLQEENHNFNQHMQPDEVSISETPGRSLGKQVSLRKTSIGGGGTGSPSTKILGLSTEQVSSQGTIKKIEPEEPPQQHQDVPLRRLAYLNKPELPIILLGTIAASACGVTVPICGILLSNAVDTYYGPSSMLKSNASFWSLMFVVIGLASTVFFPARAYFFAVAGSKLVRRVRLMSFDRVIHMEIGWFDNPENSSGAVGARLSADAAAVRCLVGDALALVVQNAAGFIAGLTIAFSASWQLALTILAFVPVMVLNAWIHMKLLSGLNATAKVIQEEATQVAADAVGSIRTVASFTAEEKMVELYVKKGEGRLAGVKQASTNGSSLGFAFLLLFGFNAICFFVGARLLEKGKATMSEVFRVYFAISMSAVGIISQSRSLAPDVTKAKSATASVFAIIDRKSMIDSSDDSGVILEVVKGAITFQHVSFSYPSRPDVQVLQDFCLAIHSGKTVALVGESGSGKSTVISLLQRFYDPDSGCILLDGVDIQKLQVRWLRKQIGLVSQEPVLFNDTIRANIAYGKGGNATEAEVLAAAKAANAHQFISCLQQGYDTLVGERAIQLSGGQKQRIAIARAMVKEPKILLLDEATSALDASCDRVVQDALYRLAANRTTVVVAHKLAAVTSADLIVVVSNGVIAEKGKHADLMNIKDGVYASLAALHNIPI